MKPKPFAIWYPPRIIMPDFTKGDHNDVLDDAHYRYLDLGVALIDEDGLKDAQKICAFAEAFPQIMRQPQ